MSTSCFVSNGIGIETISYVAIQGYGGILFRVQEKNNKVTIIPSQEDLETSIILAGNIPLIINIDGKVGDNLERIIALHDI